MDHLRTFTSWTIPECSSSRPFQISYILNRSRIFILDHSRILTFWIISELLCWGTFQNFYILDHFVTEDQELAHGYKSHQGGLRGYSFRDRLDAEGISHSEIIHIEFINVRDGGAFSDNLTWLSVLLARECKG